MGRIRILPPDVARRIAAGEVIERPASVVKELCENALDAGARRVVVELAAGGLGGIVVTDDGCGMDPEDAALAFERHATSKLGSLEDLQKLQTLGFRGEALPSIAAVATVELVTRCPDREEATRVEVEAGGRPRISTTAAAPGTRVAVRDLFAGLPARRAALRSPTQELAAATEAVLAEALARPDVAFRLLHDGREVLATPGDGDLLSVVVAIWGPEVARGMLPLSGRTEGWAVEGLCSTPAHARGSRSVQFVSVDGRPVRAELVRGAVEGAYRHLLMARRYPLFVLRLRADPGEYDANVHPSKQEVRVYRPERVRQLCHAAVRTALRRAELLVDALPPGTAVRGPEAAAGGEETAFALGEAAEPGRVYRGAGGGRPAPLPLADPLGPADEATAAAWSGPRLPELRVLGQVRACYLVAEGSDGLYLVDQHAAHERVEFEARADRGTPGAPLLQPVPVALAAADYARWERAREALAAAGMVTEEFGPGTVLVRSVPMGLEDDPAEVLLQLLRSLEGPDPGPVTARLATAACRAAVKAGQPLTPGEAEALLRRLADCRDPLHCPHGRPTLLRLRWEELEARFGRR